MLFFILSFVMCSVEKHKSEILLDIFNGEYEKHNNKFIYLYFFASFRMHYEEQVRKIRCFEG